MNIVELSFNQISEIDWLTFANATQLKFIDISHNLLITLPTNVFASNKNLELLYLNGNNLHEIGNLCESHFPKLKAADISQNNFNCTYLSHLRESCEAKIDLGTNEKAIGMDEIDCNYESSTTHRAEFTTESDKITEVTRTPSVENTTQQPNFIANENHLNVAADLKPHKTTSEQVNDFVNGNDDNLSHDGLPSSQYSISINNSHNFTALFQISLN